MSASERFFAPCPRGLETVLADEFLELSLSSVAPHTGGVRFSGSLVDAYRVNLCSRLASRVLWEVADGPYRTELDVYQLAARQSWGDWFDVDQTIRVDVSATKSPLKSLEFLTLRVKDAVCDQLRGATGRRPSVDTQAPDVRIYAYLTSNHCSLYLDTSGEALFKRGWRKAVGEAPLRENLAAGVLRLAGWGPATPLMDPMCGSGTFIVEAAQIALGIAPGSRRSFGFERLRNFDGQAWAALRERPIGEPAQEITMSASDVAGDAVTQTRVNLSSAGVPDHWIESIAPKQVDARHIRPIADAGIMVVNPPYGERIGVRGAIDSDSFFTEFGNTLKQRFAGWQSYILTNDMAFQRKLRLAPSRRTPLYNGALECRLYRFDLVEGSARRSSAEPEAGTA